MKQKRRPHADDRRREQAGSSIEDFAAQEVNTTQDSEVVKKIQRFGGENVMAQNFSEIANDSE